MNAQCTNTNGSYTCSCLAGYSGDGITSCTGKEYSYTREISLLNMSLVLQTLMNVCSVMCVIPMPIARTLMEAISASATRAIQGMVQSAQVGQ